LTKVLFLTYFFPPAGGAGVQRPVKFLKYLPVFGFEAEVVAGDGSGIELGRDATLADECPAVKVHPVEMTWWERAAARACRLAGARWVPWYAEGLSPWMAAARRRARRALVESRAKIIFATASPFSIADVACALARESGLPWVLDLRDPWALDPIHTYPTYGHYQSARRRMRRACESADAVILNTPNAAEAFRREFPSVEAGKVFCIPNGYDPDDLPARPPSRGEQPPGRPLTIAHSGLFHTARAKRLDPAAREELGVRRLSLLDGLRFRPGVAELLARSPYYLFKAVRKLLDDGAIGHEDIRLHFIGLASEEDKGLAGRFRLEGVVNWAGYLPHQEALEKLARADVLFLPLHAVANGDPLIVPGKTYEYLALERPILGAVPPGDCRDILERSGLARVCAPTDADGIAAAVLELVREHRAGSIRVNPDRGFIRSFERKRLTGRLAEVFDRVLDGGKG